MHVCQTCARPVQDVPLCLRRVSPPNIAMPFPSRRLPGAICSKTHAFGSHGRSRWLFMRRRQPMLSPPLPPLVSFKMASVLISFMRASIHLSTHATPTCSRLAMLVCCTLPSAAHTCFRQSFFRFVIELKVKAPIALVRRSTTSLSRSSVVASLTLAYAHTSPSPSLSAPTPSPPPNC